MKSGLIINMLLWIICVLIVVVLIITAFIYSSTCHVLPWYGSSGFQILYISSFCFPVLFFSSIAQFLILTMCRQSRDSKLRTLIVPFIAVLPVYTVPFVDEPVQWMFGAIICLLLAGMEVKLTYQVNTKLKSSGRGGNPIK